ncbi:MAG: hypothetical protein MJB57_02570 [Gemmatimonadetes bacterium]|nr:hypothetical protein [Gemmatimonadota bacterium]
MDETYERELRDIVAAMPTEPCIVALVPTIPLTEASALASDVAQRVGASRAGHTLLTTFESGDARLDHEIGVEGGSGLSDVLSQSATMVGVAARGGARRFIYIPAGVSALDGEVLLRSSAWRALSSSAVRRGGTILALIPPPVLEAVSEARGERPRFEGLVWLGPKTGATERLRRAAFAIAAIELGRVSPPVGTELPPLDTSPIFDRRAPTDRRAAIGGWSGRSERRKTADRRLEDRRRTRGTPADRRGAPDPWATAAPGDRRVVAARARAARRSPETLVGVADRSARGPKMRAWERRRRRNRTAAIAIGVVVVVWISIFVIWGPGHPPGTQTPPPPTPAATIPVEGPMG